MDFEKARKQSRDYNGADAREIESALSAHQHFLAHETRVIRNGIEKIRDEMHWLFAMVTIIICACATVIIMTGCAAATANKIRYNASTQTGCPANQIRVIEQQPSIARINACGKTLVCHYRRHTGSGSAAYDATASYWECE